MQLRNSFVNLRCPETGKKMENILSAYREISPNRYRETNGLYYEDFQVGDVFEHRPGRTITDVDNIWMTLLTMNIQP
ncbi:MAG: hypothetical protein ACKO90_34530, partial [Microcystis panniformis]